MVINMVEIFLIMLNSLLQIQLILIKKSDSKKQEEVTVDLIGNKIADKLTRVSKTSPKSNSETNEEGILREKYISPELRETIIDDLRLKEENF